MAQGPNEEYESKSWMAVPAKVAMGPYRALTDADSISRWAE